MLAPRFVTDQNGQVWLAPADDDNPKDTDFPRIDLAAIGVVSVEVLNKEPDTDYRTVVVTVYAEGRAWWVTKEVLKISDSLGYQRAIYEGYRHRDTIMNKITEHTV